VAEKRADSGEHGGLLAPVIAGDQYRQRRLPGLIEVVNARSAVPRTSTLYLVATPTYTPKCRNSWGDTGAGCVYWSPEVGNAECNCTGVWAQYCIDYPSMTDVRMPETAALIRAMREAEQLRAVPQRGYAPAVARFGLALSAAEQAAGIRAAGD